MAAVPETSANAMDAPSCCCADFVSGLARDHAGRLAGIARAEGATAVDALDLVQDAFQTLLHRPDLEELKTRPLEAGPLLAAIVRNAARNARRRHHRARPHVPVEEAGLATSIASPDEALERAAEIDQLAGCMSQLGAIHRQVVTLRVLEELSGPDVARSLGLTPGHVAVLLHRARAQLAQCMAS